MRKGACMRKKQTKVYAVRHHNRSLCLFRQPQELHVSASMLLGVCMLHDVFLSNLNLQEIACLQCHITEASQQLHYAVCLCFICVFASIRNQEIIIAVELLKLSHLSPYVNQLIAMLVVRHAKQPMSARLCTCVQPACQQPGSAVLTMCTSRFVERKETSTPLVVIGL